ncbi:hypothetical protein ACP_2593 [Acidobacterium capsulatum ATCC 51196]|uniref:Uncharacterized protein n=1 Tax=Acidobacterium capsulatum (strain ATCC 51196 / DSM 11244 / BCRC 80197 / JCM 7670 / NBRC 15755 / NCIMB 13165 / 161) TaxID=240015 RepID=C1F2D4_ACIC5|nr:hypothetical protein ACP_2593 [Acidobacterium capsulatum ATCC 51196]
MLTGSSPAFTAAASPAGAAAPSTASGAADTSTSIFGLFSEEFNKFTLYKSGR